jgi:hypothetical protein
MSTSFGVTSLICVWAKYVYESIIENQTRPASLVPYAYLAALAMEYGIILCSMDDNFSSFKDHRWTNPVAEGMDHFAAFREVDFRPRSCSL